MLINRVRSIPSADTFDIPPIGEFVKRYLRESKISIDPFARNKRWATYTNDLNPETAAEYHMPADEFLQTLKDKGVVADLVIFDPPYSRRQVKEVYEGIGLHFTNDDSQYYSSNWKTERTLINEILAVGGHVLSFGWNTSGMGSFDNFTEQEILIVCHGGSRYDTLCIAEKKLAYQASLFASTRLTQREPDLWDSAPLQALSTPEADTIAGWDCSKAVSAAQHQMQRTVGKARAKKASSKPVRNPSKKAVRKPAQLPLI